MSVSVWYRVKSVTGLKSKTKENILVYVNGW